MAVQIASTPHNGNGLRPRRTRPEHVALTIERVEHLTIEIAAPAVEQRGHDTATRAVHQGIEVHHGIEELRKHLAARDNGAEAPTA
jgi:hypothetical protein